MCTLTNSNHSSPSPLVGEGGRGRAKGTRTRRSTPCTPARIGMAKRAPPASATLERNALRRYPSPGFAKLAARAMLLSAPAEVCSPSETALSHKGRGGGLFLCRRSRPREMCEPRSLVGRADFPDLPFANRTWKIRVRGAPPGDSHGRLRKPAAPASRQREPRARRPHRRPWSEMPCGGTPLPVSLSSRLGRCFFRPRPRFARQAKPPSPTRGEGEPLSVPPTWCGARETYESAGPQGEGWRCGCFAGRDSRIRESRHSGSRASGPAEAGLYSVITAPRGATGA